MVALACLGVAAVRPAPLIFGLGLVLLLSIPWSIAVVRHLTSEQSPGQAGDHADRAVG